MRKYRMKLLAFLTLFIFSFCLLSACGGAPDIEKLKEAGNVKGLIKSLGYDNDEESDEVSIARREAAWQALVEIGDPAVEPLIKGLSDKNVNVRRFSAGILGDIGDMRAADALVNALSDSMVEFNALESLCKIGAASSAKALFEYIDRDEVKNGGLIEINVNYVQPVVSGHGIVAAAYLPGTQEVHPVVVTDERPFSESRANPSVDDPPNWNALIPEAWRALGEPESIQLVLCWDKVQDVELESVDYSNGVTGKRVREECTVTLREASTGEIVAQDVILGTEPASLQTFVTEEKDFRHYGMVTPEILVDWLRPYVEG
jgi:hypothetical protein